MALVDIQDLSFAYPGSAYRALSGVSLSVEEGSLVLLCGQSGCGKSTLLRHLKRELTPHGSVSGSVRFDGREVAAMTIADSAQSVGFVMQDIEDQIVTDKVYAELAFGLESLGVKSDVIRRRIAEMASFFGIQNWFRFSTHRLSGGQKQMLNLASVMVMQPRLLILDEPTSQLDPIAASEFLHTVLRINSELGTTVLISEHRLEEVFPQADRVAVLDSGQIACVGPPREVAEALSLGEKKHVMSAAFPSAVRLFAGLGGGGECPLSVREGRRYAVERRGGALREARLPENAARVPAPAGEEGVRFFEAFFRYERGGPDVLRGMSFTAYRGGVTCILGGNGTGKSTALSLAAGLMRPYRGSVMVFGKKPEAYRKDEFFGRVVASLPQQPQALFSRRTVREELAELCGDVSRLKELADLTGIETLLNSHPNDLSGGEQQKAAFAMVLARDPALILLDEPTKGLDAFYKERFGALLTRLSQSGKTVVLATHDVEFAASYATRCLLFFDGEVVSEGEPGAFFSGNHFYTTAANRIARAVESRAVTVEQLVKELGHD